MMRSVVRAFDPAAHAVSLGLITATCLVAALVRRAARIDQIATLRAD